MIIYDLCCNNNHRFEGWFQSQTEFDRQQENLLIACPQCDSHEVRRVPSAIAIATSHTQSEIVSNRRGSPSSSAVLSANTEIKALYRQLVTAVLAHSEDVGSSFAEEARKIHYKEAPERMIRGEATSEQREELLDEGIAVFQLPLIGDEELN